MTGITKYEEGISLPCLVDGCEIGLDGSFVMALLIENQVSSKLVLKLILISKWEKKKIRS